MVVYDGGSSRGGCMFLREAQLRSVSDCVEGRCDWRAELGKGLV